jgi:dual specificity protein phosphatase-like protein
MHLPDPGASPHDPARLWHYAATQWRRLFGLNVSQINDLLFVGGEFSPVQWPDLYILGVRVVLSLQAEREDQFEGPPPARALRLLVEDFQAPTIAQLQEAVTFIRAAHADWLPVFIHCHAGVGRASLTTSAYLMTQGMSHHEAFNHVKRARPIVALTEAQRIRLIEWEQHLHAQRALDGALPAASAVSLESPA